MWMSQLCVMVLIIVALGLVPKQLDELGQTWSGKQLSDNSNNIEENILKI